MRPRRTVLLPPIMQVRVIKQGLSPKEEEPTHAPSAGGEALCAALRTVACDPIMCSPARCAVEIVQFMAVKMITGGCLGHDGHEGLGDPCVAAARRQRAADAGALEAVVRPIFLHMMHMCMCMCM